MRTFWIANLRLALSYPLLNESDAKLETPITVFLRHETNGWPDFRRVHHVGTVDFTNISFAEYLNELTNLSASDCGITLGFMEETVKSSSSTLVSTWWVRMSVAVTSAYLWTLRSRR